MKQSAIMNLLQLQRTPQESARLWHTRPRKVQRQEDLFLKTKNQEWRKLKNRPLKHLRCRWIQNSWHPNSPEIPRQVDHKQVQATTTRLQRHKSPTW